MANRAPKVQWEQLEKSLRYQFKQRDLLKQALTHRSHGPVHNERLEFLGDALLETIISVKLYNEHPDLPEGDLTRMRAAIVKGTSLLIVAKSLDFSNYIQLGEGELKSGGKRRDSILADAVEATLAAIYLDSDFATCERMTLQLFADIMHNLPDAEALKDPKTQLQEYLQSMSQPLPTYTLMAKSGPEHARKFTVSVHSLDFEAQATATSRKKAEQAAAKALLNLYQDKK